ncbi:MAG: DUF1285 domain-containing protein [Sphingopyxis sp.]
MVKLTTPPPAFAAATLVDILAYIDADKSPPVEAWHPAHCGRIDIRIAADGRWFHEGSEIRRPAMVRLFSRVLRREADGSHVLVTPAEKMVIAVEDAPFVAVELRAEPINGPTRLIFRLNTDDIVVAGPLHPLRLRDGPAGRLPYLHVRGSAERQLEARLARSVYYQLADYADEAGQVHSDGELFVIGDVA